MIYESKPQRIPQSRREAYNRRILRSIERNDGSMTREEIFNGYSGLGGLHKLKLSDYNSPYEFSQAKKESEIGQFFTPHDVCRQIVELAAPAAEERVLEMCCGMGNFSIICRIRTMPADSMSIPMPWPSHDTFTPRRISASTIFAIIVPDSFSITCSATRRSISTSTVKIHSYTT